MYLVTGGAGFIGSHLMEQLSLRGEEAVCLDDFNDFYDPSIKRRNAQGYKRLVEGDIRDAALVESVFTKYRIRKIVHLAARAGVRQSLERPLLYEDVNVKGTLNLLESARKHKVDQFVFASSSSVYGGNSKTPSQEDDRISRTVSPYAATKYAGELMCYTYHHLYGLPMTCLRLFTAYGPRQRPEMAIHKFTRLIYDGKPVPFYGDGTSARDYTYIDDIIQGVVAVLDRPFAFEVFNLGESYCVTLSRLVHLIEEISGRSAILQRLPTQAGDVEVTYADITKARTMLGYSPRTSIREGLGKFIEWFERKEL